MSLKHPRTLLLGAASALALSVPVHAAAQDLTPFAMMAAAGLLGLPVGLGSAPGYGGYGGYGSYGLSPNGYGLQPAAYYTGSPGYGWGGYGSGYGYEPAYSYLGGGSSYGYGLGPISAIASLFGGQGANPYSMGGYGLDPTGYGYGYGYAAAAPYGPGGYAPYQTFGDSPYYAPDRERAEQRRIAREQREEARAAARWRDGGYAWGGAPVWPTAAYVPQSYDYGSQGSWRSGDDGDHREHGWRGEHGHHGEHGQHGGDDED